MDMCMAQPEGVTPGPCLCPTSRPHDEEGPQGRQGGQEAPAAAEELELREYVG